MPEMVFWLLPLTGLIIGGLMGGFVGKNRISLAPFENNLLSIMSWCVFIFGLLGLEIGFIFSPITRIGLGNTSTSVDLWVFPVWVGIASTNLGALVGLLVLVVYIPIKKLYDTHNKQMEK